MKKLNRLFALLLALLLVLSACTRQEEPEEPDPVPTDTGYSATGRGNPNVPHNPYDDEAFVSVGGFTMYTAANAASHIGVDVSTHQGDIDWVQVRGAGVEFAMLRVGFRGYTGGGIYQDERFTANIQGALDAGLKVGVYFFSQAITVEEAQAEAKSVLEWIAPYEITFPVVFDWETIANDTARTDSVEPETVTECVKAFCEAIKEGGYTPMVYFNKNQGYDVMDLEQLGDYEFWLAGYSKVPNFEYAFEMWQYSNVGRIPGIETTVDLDICLVDYPEEEPEEDADGETPDSEDPEGTKA